jgi:SRSO17 transposase
MTGASIETSLELWASSLWDVKGRMRALFSQERVAGSASLFLEGLLSDERRKRNWMRAKAAAILVHGGNRLSYAEGDGTKMHFAILYKAMLLSA